MENKPSSPGVYTFAVSANTSSQSVGWGGEEKGASPPRPHAFLGANPLLPLTLLKILPGMMVTDNRVRDSFSFLFFLGRSRQVVEVFIKKVK